MPRRRGGRAVVLAALVAVLAGGGASGSSPAASSAPKTTGRAGGGATVWLCRPQQSGDPCAAPLGATVVPASGARTVEGAQAAPSSKFDCFYVYPTVSTQRSDNANLLVQPAEEAAAVAQASRFSQVCRVWAPMYRQRTETSLLKGLGDDPQADAVAYASLLSAWKDYLAHDNDGRPIVFLGHSQGAAMLIRLLASQVDPNPTLRARTVVAILAGGNVTVPVGKTVGATFRHLRLCTAVAQTGCVIAYSSFPSPPPADSDFGRPGQGVSLQSGQRATNGVQVACVNPAALEGGVAGLDPYFLTATSAPPPPPVATPWVTYPDLYSASCQQAGGATWLQVNTLTVAGRPVVTESLGPDWGYHVDDVNLALGNLVDDVRAEEVAFAAQR
ncbi:MAG TPA: DUF3089 domain-containing protein [Acidimicrobiales bacterium]|nr:DUF3089 domain-containing protein [Acidimicrobiales bacterium]